MDQNTKHLFTHEHGQLGVSLAGLHHATVSNWQIIWELAGLGWPHLSLAKRVVR